MLVPGPGIKGRQMGKKTGKALRSQNGEGFEEISVSFYRKWEAIFEQEIILQSQYTEEK